MLDGFLSLWPDLQKAIGETLLMVGITMVFAVLVGIPLGLLLFLTRDGGLSPRPLLNRVTAAAVNALRSFPFIILMVLLIPVARIVVGTSIGPRAAALALSVAAIPFFARLVEQNLREVPRGVVDAAIASGASSWQIIRYVLLPEARPGLIGSVTITATGFIAYSAVAGAIGAGGLGDLAIRYGYYRFETDVMVWCVIVMFVLVQGTQWIGDWLVRRLDRR
ncbi:methionine ABC transporter permease [Falsiroseomonas sp. HW251]|uniref:methionine ABC transporter permease n=1 Tax=Falsiroseomonas sp. HW251 TaxID=3390998 RepID=UPI003D3177C7